MSFFSNYSWLVLAEQLLISITIIVRHMNKVSQFFLIFFIMKYIDTLILVKFLMLSRSTKISSPITYLSHHVLIIRKSLESNFLSSNYCFVNMCEALLFRNCMSNFFENYLIKKVTQQVKKGPLRCFCFRLHDKAPLNKIEYLENRNLSQKTESKHSKQQVNFLYVIVKKIGTEKVSYFLIFRNGV